MGPYVCHARLFDFVRSIRGHSTYVYYIYPTLGIGVGKLAPGLSYQRCSGTETGGSMFVCVVVHVRAPTHPPTCPPTPLPFTTC